MQRFNLTARLRGSERPVAGLRFDDMGDWAAALAGPIADTATWKAEQRSTWVGADSAVTLARCRAGDAARVALADAMLSRLEDAVGFEARRWRTVDAVAGGAPNVPAMLAGSPLAMRRRARVMDHAAPLSIFVDLGVSQSVNADTLARRGAAALALARIAAGSRPVDLWATFAARGGDGGDAVMAVRIDTAPLDVARAAWVLCAPEALRRAGFATLALAGGWAESGDVRWMDEIEKHKRASTALLSVVTGAADALVVPPLYSGGEVDFTTDAAAADWVKAQLATLGAVERAA